VSASSEVSLLARTNLPHQWLFFSHNIPIVRHGTWTVICRLDRLVLLWSAYCFWGLFIFWSNRQFSDHISWILCKPSFESTAQISCTRTSFREYHMQFIWLFTRFIANFCWEACSWYTVPSLIKSESKLRFFVGELCYKPECWYGKLEPSVRFWCLFLDFKSYLHELGKLTYSSNLIGSVRCKSLLSFWSCPSSLH